MKAQTCMRTVVLAVAAAASLTGTAQAEPEYQAGMRLRAQAGIASASPDWFERAAARASTGQSLSPVPKVSGGAASTSAGISPDWFERAAARENVSRLGVPAPEVSEQTTQGGVTSGPSLTGASFNWSDAMLGAGSTLGVVLLGAAVLTIRRRGQMLSQ